MQLGSALAVVVAKAGNCSSSSTPSLGTSICLKSNNNNNKNLCTFAISCFHFLEYDYIVLYPSIGIVFVWQDSVLKIIIFVWFSKVFSKWVGSLFSIFPLQAVFVEPREEVTSHQRLSWSLLYWGISSSKEGWLCLKGKKEKIEPLRRNWCRPPGCHNRANDVCKSLGNGGL